MPNIGELISIRSLSSLSRSFPLALTSIQKLTTVWNSYTVDRQKSVVALQRFLDEKEQKLQEEVAWLLSEGINCVLSDAAFLGW